MVYPLLILESRMAFMHRVSIVYEHTYSKYRPITLVSKGMEFEEDYLRKSRVKLW